MTNSPDTAPLKTVITVVHHDTTGPTCRCGAALRLVGSLDAGACCCCRDHPAGDPICQICTAYLMDTDDSRVLCAKCREITPSTGTSGDTPPEGVTA